MPTNPQMLALAQQVFEELLDTPPAERASRLHARCSDQPQVLTLVHELLVIHDQGMGRFLDRPLGLPRRMGPYEVGPLLGRGGMGAVYAAFDTRLHRDVALKTVPSEHLRVPGRLERLESEARVLARLNHPNIAAIYALEEHGDLRYFVMERVTGDTLASRLREGPLPIDRCLRLGRQIAGALEAAHGAGVIHRDLKPANVLLDAHQNVKIVDFGIARTFGDSTRRLDEARSGTPGYMSPEQTAGADATPSTDLWAFGCLLFECLTGARLVPADTPTEQRRHHETSLVPDLSDLPSSTPDSLRRLLETCLRANPLERRVDAGLARRTLEAEYERRRFAELAGECAEGAPARANQEPDAPAAPRNNLPLSVTSFIGRARETEQIGAALQDHRCVTLVGPGGCGKTRLALEIARTVLTGYPSGVWLVELADTGAGSPLEHIVASALGMGDQQSDAPLAAVLRARWNEDPALVVLDNCDHRIAECATFAEMLLATCPGVRILVTSRERLRWTGERVYELTPLGVGSPSHMVAGREDDAPDEALQLFLDRAGAAGAAVAMTPDSLELVRSICRRLEGLPLAIELAAARLRIMSLRELDDRLSRDFDVLSSRMRSATSRHGTLTAAFDWSIDELGEPTRALYRRLAVFGGAFDLAAAEAVAADDLVPAWQIFELLTELLEKSLVSRDLRPDSTTSRYRLLQTVREHARHRLRSAGEENVLVRKHHRHFVEFAEARSRGLSGPRQAGELRQLDEEMDNFRAALAFDLERAGRLAMVPHPEESPDECLRLSQALGSFWATRGFWREGAHICQRLITAMEPLVPRVRVAAVLNSTGILLQQLGQFRDALEYFEDALAMNRQLHDREGVAASLGNLGVHAFFVGDTDRCRRLLEQSAQEWEALGASREIAKTRQNLGVLAYTRGDFAGARADLEIALRHYRADGDTKHVSRALLNLGNVHYQLGNLDASETHQNEALALARSVGDRVATFSSLTGLGLVAQARHDLDTAEQHYREGLAISREHGDRLSISRSLHNLGTIHLDRGDLEGAAALVTEALQIRREIGDREGVAECLLSLGQTHVPASSGPDATISEADLQGAAQFFLRSLEAYTAIDHQLGTVRCLEQLARLSAPFAASDRRSLLRVADAIRNEIGAARTPVEGATVSRLRTELAKTGDPHGAGQDLERQTGSALPSKEQRDEFIRRLLTEHLRDE